MANYYISFFRTIHANVVLFEINAERYYLSKHKDNFNKKDLDFLECDMNITPGLSYKKDLIELRAIWLELHEELNWLQDNIFNIEV
jgi:hypothetical protein